MNDKDYMNMLYVLNDAFDNELKLFIEWANGLRISCLSITGTYETDSEFDSEEYIGEYAAVVGDIDVLNKGNDDSVSIFNNCIEISVKNVPNKILSEDGNILWEK